MKFTIDRKALLEGLKFVGAAAGMKSTLPVLSNVLVEAPQTFEQTVKLNSHYLEHAMNAVRVGDLAIEVEETNAPLVIRSGEVTAVVMPMKVEA